MTPAKQYWFDSEEGPRTLAELFGGHRRLLVPHLPLDADWRDCPAACVAAGDRWEAARVRLGERGIALVAVADAPIDAIAACKWRMGWSFAWVSSLRTGFDRDCGAAASAAAGRPALSVFALRDGTVHHLIRPLEGPACSSTRERSAASRSTMSTPRGSSTARRSACASATARWGS